MAIKIKIIKSLAEEIEENDEKTKKLFHKQKLFMEINPHYNSLGRTKLKNVRDKYGNQLWEIRLDGRRRIVFVERGDNIVWLKICDHDEIKRNNTINVGGNY
jgi:hypothetical protein